ncbi:MAG: glycosyltransferase [Paenibacillaceae bacterium]|nr:glycosyltransferase [Paenibacillaceae bacterium]
MKVMLLGEFSALHKYLKNGLQELGNIEVELAANGDGWKKINGADIYLPDSNQNRVRGKFNLYCENIKIASKFKGYDVVQLIQPLLFPMPINNMIINYIKNNNKCLSLVSAGGDQAIVKAYLEGKFEYYMWDYYKAYLDKYDSNKLRGRLNIMSSNNTEQKADVIIPILYEYSVGYSTNRLSNVIPFGINLKEIKYMPNIVKNGKIVFFHGLNNEEKKGTIFIRKALNRLAEKYPNEVEIIIDGHMPFEKYLEVMKRANVVIDQCCSYGYGINAGIAMAEGKVVMSGARNETLYAIGRKTSPIIHIKPDVNFIYTQLEKLMHEKNMFESKGYYSRKYVEDVHDHIKVAENYLKTWKLTGKI